MNRLRIAALGLAVAIVLALSASGSANAVSTTVVISQAYGGGGNAGATYTNDYIELFNRGSTTFSLAGWSLQYTSATGTGLFGDATNLITPLSGSLAPGQYLLVQESSGGASGAALPTPDVTDASPINMSATGGKIALVNTTTALGCNGSSTPCSPAALATIVDLIGYDGANFFEGAAAAPTLSNTTAAFRDGGGCSDTDNNAADFLAGSPSPRNSSSALHFCVAGNRAPTAGAGGPYSVSEGASTGLSGTGSDLDGDPLTFSWDLNNDAIFETPGQSVTFSAAGLDGPASQIVVLQACDNHQACTTASTLVQITNVVPSVAAGADAVISSGQSHSVSATFVDAGTPDTHTATIDWDDGSPVENVVVTESAGSGSLGASHTYLVPATYAVKVCVTDDDGGVGCDGLNVEVKRLVIQIDIKPGSSPNPINLKSRGNVPVGLLTGIYGGVSVQATAVLRSSLVFAGAPELGIGGSPDDIDGDGDLDAVFHFSTQGLNLTASSTQACLEGRTSTNVYFTACDSIRIVP